MRIAVVGLTCALLVGCATPSAVTDRRSAVALTIEQVKSDLSELSLQVVPAPSRQATEYFKYYGLMPTGAMHFFGTFRSGGNQLVAHVYRPRNSHPGARLLRSRGHMEESAQPPPEPPLHGRHFRAARPRAFQWRSCFHTLLFGVSHGRPRFRLALPEKSRRAVSYRGPQYGCGSDG